jgi:hypothetical protein
MASDAIDGWDVLDSKEHVEGRVSLGGDVMGHHAFSEFEILKNSKPLG